MAPHAAGFAAIVACVAPLIVGAAQDSRSTAVSLTERIQRADYEGDRAALQKLADDIGALRMPTSDAHLVSRVHYWRGFALWRRAFNGLAQSSGAPEIERDLEKALAEFELAISVTPAFVDAKAGAISCLGNLLFLRKGDPDSVRAFTSRGHPMLEESLAAEPDNPRLLWVLGAQQLNTSPTAGGGFDKAVATYQKGLAAARRRSNQAGDALDPTWGLPELLMALAGTSLRATPPDPDAAEGYAKEALTLVPHWRTLREGMLPRIERAKP
jgi:hypothetical protein